MRKVSFEIDTNNFFKLGALEGLAECNDETIIKIIYHLVKKDSSTQVSNIERFEEDRRA